MISSIKCPEPGIYPNIPFDEYLSWEAVSNSRLNQANKSLAHFNANIGPKESKDLRLGSLTHAGRLEPLSIPKLYAVMPAFENEPGNTTQKGLPSTSKNTKYYTDKVAEFELANPGKEIVDAEMYAKMEAMVASLDQDLRAIEWFNEPGFIEVSLVWIDPVTGLRCKARVDKAARDWSRFTDLKTSKDVLEFPKAIANLGYHRQMAHYSNGVRILKNIDPEACIVAVEKAAPYCTRSAPMAKSVLEQGRTEVADLLRMVADAIATDHWPGYESPDQWELPPWYCGSFADEADEELSNWLLTAKGEAHV